jgi:glc operon protein GlcG
MNTKLQLSESEALKIVEVIYQKLLQEGKAAAVAVADEHGELLAFLRTGGCPLPAINIAINKAFTAARERTKTSTLGARSRNERFPMTNFGDLRYNAFGGGVPLIHDGTVFGGIGVSGLSEEEDEQIALLGAATIS